MDSNPPDTDARSNAPEIAHPDSILLRVSEVASRLALSEARVYELLASQRLPSVKIERSRRVRLTDLIKFIEDAAA